MSNQRDYIGLDKLIDFGKETFDRYNQPESGYQPKVAELYEKIENRWIRLSSEETFKLFENGK